jgi:hypothetical protein
MANDPRQRATPKVQAKDDTRYVKTLEDLPHIKSRAQRYTGGVTRMIPSICTTDFLYSNQHLFFHTSRLLKVRFNFSRSFLEGRLINFEAL